VQMRSGQIQTEYLVDIKKFEQLRGNEFSAANGLIIGALSTHRDLELSSIIRERYTVLYDGVSRVGSVQIRNRGTIGGNICNALPSADSLAPLLALGAKVVLRGVSGEREMELRDFLIGPRKTALKTGEILTHIIVPPGNELCGGAYIKFTRRKAMDLALLGVAVYQEYRSDLATCSRIRIAMATAAPVPMRAIEAENFLIGKKLTDPEVLQQVGEIASKEARPRTSWRSTEEYRRHLLKVLVPRAIKLAHERMLFSRQDN
ncbi:MAG: xanthine dehydrogenase family protein subunit M, partial [Clostridia bacterium]|nr:xanthine dehydrogenase family protein subunit M [Clostridia bacterium]